jgi:hypothetical protein
MMVAAVGIFVAGAVAALATADAVGWRETESEGQRLTASASARRVYTLRAGDVVIRREAATRCEASGEAGVPNLFCTRIARGRHQVIFYADCVLVWPLARGPDGPPFMFGWKPQNGCR